MLILLAGFVVPAALETDLYLAAANPRFSVDLLEVLWLSIIKGFLSVNVLRKNKNHSDFGVAMIVIAS